MRAVCDAPVQTRTATVVRKSQPGWCCGIHHRTMQACRAGGTNEKQADRWAAASHALQSHLPQSYPAVHTGLTFSRMQAHSLARRCLGSLH